MVLVYLCGTRGLEIDRIGSDFHIDRIGFNIDRIGIHASSQCLTMQCVSEHLAELKDAYLTDKTIN
jgi:hypothetical protein